MNPSTPRGYSPVLARTVIIRRSLSPLAHDCLMFAFAREGSAFLRGSSKEGPFEKLHFREGDEKRWLDFDMSIHAK